MGKNSVFAMVSLSAILIMSDFKKVAGMQRRLEHVPGHELLNCKRNLLSVMSKREEPGISSNWLSIKPKARKVPVTPLKYRVREVCVVLSH